MKIYIVGTYTESYNDSWLYCRAFRTRKEAEDWIADDRKQTEPGDHVTYDIFEEEI